MDITRAKKYRNAMEKNLNMMNQAEEIAQLGFYERNWQTGEGYWSDGFYKLLGIKPQEKKYSHEGFIKFIHPEDQKMVEKYVMESLEKKVNMEVEFRLNSRDGKVRDILGVGKNIYDPDGKPHLTIGIFLDITERKRISEDLKEALNAAEEADRLKSAFLANMSHEIRTPLNGIIGFTTLLKDPDVSDDEKNKYIKIIEKNGRRLLDTINNLINISKIESGQMGIYPSRFDP
jgi:PAS domain S-box-containing protein